MSDPCSPLVLNFKLANVRLVLCTHPGVCWEPGIFGQKYICRGGTQGYQMADILQPALRPRSNVSLPDICSLSGAQHFSMEALVRSYLMTQNFQISEPTRGSPERVAMGITDHTY